MFTFTSELDLIIGLVMIILYGLYSLLSASGTSNGDVVAISYQQVYLADVHFFSRCWPVLVLVGFLIDGVDIFSAPYDAGFNLNSLTIPLSTNFGIQGMESPETLHTLWSSEMSNHFATLDFLLCLVNF